MAEPNFKAWFPSFGIRSYQEAIDHYVDWLGFHLDDEWREAPGEPAIAWISRDGLTLVLNESPRAPTGTWLTVHVADIQALADEWNGRRPGSVEVVNGAPYEFPVLYMVDPFGNRIDFQQLLTDAENEARRRDNVPRMREFIRQRIAEGKPVPTPQEVADAAGPSVGIAIEVLNEFPEYREAFQAKRERAERDLGLDVVELAPQPALAIVREARLEELRDQIADVLPKVHLHLTGLGAAPAGMPFMRFLDLTQKFTVAIGWPIASEVEAEGDVERCELPGGRAATALYTGPPYGSTQAWDRVIAHAASQGHRPTGAWGGLGGWQVYLNDPAVVGEANAQTRLYLPLGD